MTTIDTSTMTRHRALTARTVLVTVLAMLAALLTGTLTGCSGGDGAGDVVLAGEGQLTDRQERIADFVAECEKAWQEGDGEAVAAMFTPDGVLTALGEEYHVADGSLATFVGMQPWSSLEVARPILVSKNVAVFFNSYGGVLHMDIMRFTTDGDLLLISHEII